ncbi:MAG: hypothetical protein AB1896_23690 [Thermodesulfobacteriota bacterium]
MVKPSLNREELAETMAFCLDQRICFRVTGREETDLVKEVADRLGFAPFKVQELEKGEVAFFIGPFGTIIFGQVVEKDGPLAVWKGLDNNKNARFCTITSAIYRRIPRDAHDCYMVWARRNRPDRTEKNQA